MRTFIAILLLSMMLPLTTAQEKEKWKRVITFDESVVDLNVSQVSFGEGDIAQVKFRTTYSKLVPVRGGGNYKVLVEVMDFRCQERLYRLSEETFFDKKGTVIPMPGTSVSAEWKPVKSQGMMERLLAPACELIKEKRQYH
jgi:hypothetical protein